MAPSIPNVYQPQHVCTWMDIQWRIAGLLCASGAKVPLYGIIFLHAYLESCYMFLQGRMSNIQKVLTKLYIKYNILLRCAARLGRALCLGYRNHRFKSCHTGCTRINKRESIYNPWQGHKSVSGGYMPDALFLYYSGTCQNQ